MSATVDGRTDRTVVIVGGGPAGLGAAIALRETGVEHVVVLEREQTAGGIPRHTDHLGFGVRDLRRVLRGPAYAARLVDTATQAGVDLRVGTTVLDVTGDGVTLADGSRLDAHAVVLATGVRERPRSARLVPGDRPAGVFTTGAIQQLTALQHRMLGERAVIVGAEHVSFSAIWTLRHGGCTPVAMVTPLPRHQTSAALRLASATRHGVPILTGADIAEIRGRGRVDEVVLSDGRRIACDTVVFTGDWIPDHEIARRAGTTMVRASRAPLVDDGFRTSVAGVFAIGNLVHPAEAADVCALDGRSAASAIMALLAGGGWPAPRPIEVSAPVTWAAMSSAGVTVRVDRVLRGRIVVSDASGVIARTSRRTLVPNRAIHVRIRREPGTTEYQPLSVTVTR